MNILLLGSGGRECAIAAKLAQSPLCTALFIAPGNGGTRQYGTNVAISPTDFAAIDAFARRESIDMIVPGNEDPLVAGIADYMAEHLPGVLVAGPRRAGAMLEGSKDHAKAFMTRHGIPTARYRSFTAATLAEGRQFLAELQPPYVLKADGLAAGKGVLILPTLAEAQKALEEMLAGQFGQASATVVIEEFLSGVECSVFALTDGHGRYLILPEAKDYKRAGEGDKGLNTGGMGAVSPVPFCDARFMGLVEDRIVRPTVEGLLADGVDYRGFIFFGLINVGGEPMVIEYNVRMGDPETEVVMPRLRSDLVELLAAAAKGDLSGKTIEADPRTAVTVMAVAGGYPGSYGKGMIIEGNLNPAGSEVYHAGTDADAEGRLATSGGRVLAVTSLAPSIADARERSYAALEHISFEGMNFRRDIGLDLMAML